MSIKRRKYKSRREKFERDKRNFSLVFIFGMIALAVIAFKNRLFLFDWFMVTFID